VIALSKLYTLNDPRIAHTTVKGDLIIPTSTRIMTRSQARANPDRFTAIPAPLKIIKVLIEELLSASGAQSAALATAAAEFADEEGDDDGWEDVPSVLDLAGVGTKEQLMAFGEGSTSGRVRDDETQAYLTEFFMKVCPHLTKPLRTPSCNHDLTNTQQISTENTAGFSEIYAALTDDEKQKLSELAQQAQ
jgi:hypothetical protein